MKKNIVIVICVLLIIQSVQVFAYNYPTNFWTINTKYENAINASTHDKIIEYGNQIINLMQEAADGPKKRNILVTCYNQVGISYAA